MSSKSKKKLFLIENENKICNQNYFISFRKNQSKYNLILFYLTKVD